MGSFEKPFNLKDALGKKLDVQTELMKLMGFDVRDVDEHHRWETEGYAGWFSDLIKENPDVSQWMNRNSAEEVAQIFQSYFQDNPSEREVYKTETTSFENYETMHGPTGPDVSTGETVY